MFELLQSSGLSTDLKVRTTLYSIHFKWSHTRASNTNVQVSALCLLSMFLDSINPEDTTINPEDA